MIKLLLWVLYLTIIKTILWFQ